MAGALAENCAMKLCFAIGVGLCMEINAVLASLADFQSNYSLSLSRDTPAFSSFVVDSRC
jgi:hypothetical protein